MNLAKFTDARLDNFRSQLKSSKITDPLLKKYKCTLENGRIFHKGKYIVSREDINKFLNDAVMKNGAPLSIEQLYWWSFEKVWGVSRRRCAQWLKSKESYQLSLRRPFQHSKENRHTEEGVVRHILKSHEGTVGYDLVDLARNNTWTKFSYLFVAVHYATNFCWIYPIKRKIPSLCLIQLKKVLADSKKRFGHNITQCAQDDGPEFKGVFKAFLKTNNIKRKVLKTVTFVEKMNQLVCRTLGMLRSEFGWNKALELTRDKVNNIRSRITRRTANSFTSKDFKMKRPPRFYRKNIPLLPLKKIQPRYKRGDKVRHLLKYATKLKADPFYKSYESLTHPDKGIWSKKVHTVHHVIRPTRYYAYFRYLVNRQERPPLAIAVDFTWGYPIQKRKTKKRKRN